jgi:hypothetical protein
MNFKSRLNVALNPHLDLHGRMQPVDFAVRGGGRLDVATGAIHARVDVVPMQVAMPFMRNRRVVLFAVGPFHLTIKPVTLTLQSSEVNAEGRIGGEEGIEGTLDVRGKCQAEITAAGEADVKSIKASFEGVFDQ